MHQQASRTHLFKQQKSLIITCKYLFNTLSNIHCEPGTKLSIASHPLSHVILYCALEIRYYYYHKFADEAFQTMSYYDMSIWMVRTQQSRCSTPTMCRCIVL